MQLIVFIPMNKNKILSNYSSEYKKLFDRHFKTFYQFFRKYI